MPRPETSFEELQHVAVKVSNIEESLKFYTETLGFTLSERHDPSEHPSLNVGLCFLRCSAFHHDLNLVYPHRRAARACGAENRRSGSRQGPGVASFRVSGKKPLRVLRLAGLARGMRGQNRTRPRGAQPHAPGGRRHVGREQGHVFLRSRRPPDRNLLRPSPGWTRPTASRRNGMKTGSAGRESTPPPHPPVGPHPTGALRR